jgi:hypothetical protein
MPDQNMKEALKGIYGNESQIRSKKVAECRAIAIFCIYGGAGMY